MTVYLHHQIGNNYEKDFYLQPLMMKIIPINYSQQNSNKTFRIDRKKSKLRESHKKQISQNIKIKDLNVELVSNRNTKDENKDFSDEKITLSVYNINNKKLGQTYNKQQITKKIVQYQVNSRAKDNNNNYNVCIDSNSENGSEIKKYNKYNNAKTVVLKRSAKMSVIQNNMESKVQQNSLNSTLKQKQLCKCLICKRKNYLQHSRIQSRDKAIRLSKEHQRKKSNSQTSSNYRYNFNINNNKLQISNVEGWRQSEMQKNEFQDYTNKLCSNLQYQPKKRLSKLQKILNDGTRTALRKIEVKL